MMVRRSLPWMLLLSLRTSYFLLRLEVTEGRVSSSQWRSLVDDEPTERKSKSNDDDSDQNDGHAFLTATHTPAAFRIDDNTVDTAAEALFTPASSLEVFKNIDPTKFAWMNPSNVQAGKTTCGFLYPTLGAEPGVNYPLIKVYICVQFADIQPAPKGNLVVHCGGPQTTSSCFSEIDAELPSMKASKDIKNDYFGEKNAANYNIITIDQRGAGRSFPSFYHNKCEQQDDNLTLNDGDEYNATILQGFLDDQKDIQASCWGCTDCDFNFNNVEQLDGSSRSFHFLEYSGTRQLVEDLNRFRVLVKAPKLSLYGLSYGTGVMGTFATLFPNNVDKFILDANMSPYNTRDTISKEEAIGLTLRYDYLKFTCWAARIKNPDNCPVDPDELVNCIGKLKQLQTIIQSNDDAKGRVPDYVLSLLNKAGGSLLDFLLLLLSDDPETMGKVCAADDEDATLGLLEGFSSPQKRGVGLEKKSMSCNAYGEGEDDDFCTDYCSTYDRPSATYGPVCFDFDPFGGGRDPSNPVFNLVTAQDVTGGVNAYNNKVFIKQVLAFQDEYGSEYNHPMHEMISHLLASYYWPKSVPLPVLGNPSVTGIIAGTLYDTNTPFIWTSQMRANFPLASALTSQSIFHGLTTGVQKGVDPLNVTAQYKDPCQQYVVKYLETGIIDWTTGTVCGDPFPYFSDQISGRRN